jgi:hypothetical protein
MRKCNKCSKIKDESKFRYGKRTCKKCEYRFKQRFLRYLVLDKRLSAKERIANRLGYMGTAFIMMSPYLLTYGAIGGITYVIGGILSIPQVFVAKQWNLVAVNINVTIGYIIYLCNV